MRNFRFRLEGILSWRRQAFELEEARLAPLVSELSRLDVARGTVAAARELAPRDLLSAEALAGHDLSALALYRARLGKEQETIERQSAEYRDRMARQLAQIVEAHRRLRLLEKVRERRLEEWRAQRDREAETFASEAYLARWTARKTGSHLIKRPPD